MTAWLNGALTTQPVIDPTDRGFTLGDGLFETIRAVGGRGLHLKRHWRRLRAGAAVLEGSKGDDGCVDLRAREA